MNKLIEFAKEQCEIFPEDSHMGMYLRETLKMLQAEHCTLDDAREDFMFDVYNILKFLPTNNEANQIIDVFDSVTSGLEQEPCKDAVSRADAKKSKWVIKYHGFPPEPSTVCSNCGYDIDFEVSKLVKANAFAIEPYRPNYCPNCGAEMESNANE